MIVALPIALMAIVVMIVLARQANTRFAAHERLPMQWWIDGTPTWSLPRRFALAFMPAVGGASLLPTALAVGFGPAPTEGNEIMVLSVIIVMSVGVVAIQLLHYWMIARHLRS